MKIDRKVVNLTLLLTFAVMVVSGMLAFFLPFSIRTTGLHALMGFVFLGLIGIHLSHNGRRLTDKQQGWTLLIVPLLITASLTALFIWQPKPVKAVLAASHNLGAALDIFEIDETTAVYHYSPAENFKLKLQIRLGTKRDSQIAPEMAIWLENQSSYHIKTLHQTDSKEHLPYWAWKVREYKAAKDEAENAEPEEIDAISSATPNASFEPRDYILPERNTEPFYLLVEVNQPGDGNDYYEDQPSLIYRVEIDNAHPSYYQVLELIGFPKFDPEEESWNAYFPDEKLSTCLELIDSALLIIDR